QYDSRNAYILFSHALLPLLTEHFDISGPATAVNAGGVSAHLAIVAAVDALLARQADMVIAGGMQGVVSPQYLMPYAKLGLLSKSEAMHPFGQDADGLLLGEGGGFAVLKRLDDAIRDEDRIYAIVRGAASAAGGNVAKNGASLTALCRAVCRQAGIDPASVKLVEGEGAALPAQDKDEVRSIAAIYPDGSRPGPGTVALGSVKGLIGHTGPAAGAAGLIKAALSLYQRVIPPSQEAGRPNSQLKLGETPFYLNLSPRPWIHNDQGFPRRAAVTALTFDGYAACILLEQFRGAR
ncbi:MAG: polyketide synthase, partial [Kiritimatiellae bacterium]|nr:polyketide synthase [Kiritimatiellia bacterium]